MTLSLHKLDLRDGVVDLSHGAGSRATAQLIAELFFRHLGNPYLGRGDDGAVLPLPGFDPTRGRIVVATDAHVVTPLFFAGGDIGSLSVHGTINDVAVMGAQPLYLTASFILEEGFPLADLDRIVASMGKAAREAGVPVVAGDTKVVERGKGDGVYIATTGVGILPTGVELGGARARPGDALLVSGTLGDHGVAILSQRENLSFSAPIVSDSAALHTLVAQVLATGADIRCLRDPTRGGLAGTLHEIAQQSNVGITLRESALPIHPVVAGACELLGIDPLYIANEGKLVVVCAAQDAARVLAALRAHPLGSNAALIGIVVDDPHRFVQVDTAMGGRRIVDWLSADQLPRIC
ncbi:hydrogenase expression/formation protein HypE [Candidatus Symbiobacter mobilis]|uniref:Hydrogenase maturation protein HypE n=1 Tax=Candidatus Symbiobacter mobilis CR TaxID=946483 RepID=U5N5X0_9BURK|nr:hydrogenase expression/formation protein HypE [Candidatus Symbiobacter mobilis]AGX86762.1 hydrogenase maturation protein HypE [Candidatus Symbiobacter mobilis CR]